VVPGAPPAAESVHLRAGGKVLVVEGGATEGVEVHVGTGLAERDLARSGSRGEWRGHLPAAGGDPRTNMRKARRPLASPRSGQAGALDELELVEAAVPHALQVVDADPRALADDPLGGGGRQGVRLSGGAHDGDRQSVGHAGEDVARRATQV